MTTTLKRRPKTKDKQASLKKRIRQFYGFLNRREFRRCYEMIDPLIRDKPTSVTLLQYENALSQFLDRFGVIKVADIELTLHLDVPNKLYAGRDFAMGKTTWKDASGVQHPFSERWVRNGRTWHTCSTGYVVPG